MTTAYRKQYEHLVLRGSDLRVATCRQARLVVFDRGETVAVTVNGVVLVAVIGSFVLLLSAAIVSWWAWESVYALVVRHDHHHHLRHRVIDCVVGPSNDFFWTSCPLNGYDACDPLTGYGVRDLLTYACGRDLWTVVAHELRPYCYLLHVPYRGYGETTHLFPCVNTQRLVIAIHSFEQTVKFSKKNLVIQNSEKMYRITSTLIACGLHYLVSVHCFGLAAAMWWHYALPINSHKHRSDGLWQRSDRSML